MRFLGVDPGQSGGFALLDDDEYLSPQAWSMPKTNAGVIWTLRDDIGGPRGVLVMMEQVHASPQMGVTSAFTFGKGFGGLVMALECLSFDVEFVSPQRWQRAMNILTPKEQRAKLGTKDKNISKREAQRLFPSVKVTHAVADALLLAEYCRRIRGARLPWQSET